MDPVQSVQLFAVGFRCTGATVLGTMQEIFIGPRRRTGRHGNLTMQTLTAAFVNISKSCVNNCVLLSELQKAFPSIKYLRLLLPICQQMENPV